MQARSHFRALPSAVARCRVFQPSKRSRCVCVAAKGDDAARRALQDMFQGKKDVLAKNDMPAEGGGDGKDGGGDGGSGGDGQGGSGGFGGFGDPRNIDFAAGLRSFHEACDPWLRFLAAGTILLSLPFIKTLFAGGFQAAMKLMRLNGAGRRINQEVAVVDDKDGKLGADEKSIIAKYGDGTDDVFSGAAGEA